MLKVLKKELRGEVALQSSYKLVNPLFYLHLVTTHLVLGCDVQRFITFQWKI